MTIGRALRVLAVALGVPVVLYLGAVFALVAYFGPSFDELNASLEELHVPSGWRFATTFTNGPGGDLECTPRFNPTCPMVVHYYVATGTAVSAFDEATKMIANAGFVLDSTGCGFPPSGAECAALGGRSERGVMVQVWGPGREMVGEVKISTRSGPVVSVAMWIRANPSTK